MHIAFDGGCFQQRILGGIYQVACGFLNAAKARDPSLRVTLVCDPRQGSANEQALLGLSWAPDIIYAPVAAAYDTSETAPWIRNPDIRFFIDGAIVPADIDDGIAHYRGKPPSNAFAVLSRSTRTHSGGPKKGIRIHEVEITGDGGEYVKIKGSDRRLINGFLVDSDETGWTDGVGFLPIRVFPDGITELSLKIMYTPAPRYELTDGVGADLIRATRAQIASIHRKRQLQDLGNKLKESGCAVYFANHFTPISIPNMLNVAWAYDLIPILFPQYFHQDARRNFDENLTVFSRADRVYAISDCTRADLVNHTDVAPNKAITAGISVADGFGPNRVADIQPTLRKWGLRTGDYIIFVATIEPRKNHLRMLLAYIELRKKMPHCPDLLFVGSPGWDFQQVLAFREDNELQSVVKILSDVSESDLSALYSGASFSAYLSVYEGFGLPIIEAMTCGCPVLTSDRSSMAEVAGDAARLVNPYDIEAITDAMGQLIENEALRTKLSRRGIDRARQYSWRRSSDIIMQDIEMLVGQT